MNTTILSLTNNSYSTEKLQFGFLLNGKQGVKCDSRFFSHLLTL